MAAEADPRAPADGPDLRLAAEGPGLETRSLGKSFRRRPVVRDVSLQLRRGEAVGLLGPNGAGKTTCFYMITGLIPADAGEIRIDGQDVTALPMYRRARLGLGYLPQEASIFRGLTVEENLLAVLELVEPSRARRSARLDQLLAEFNVEHLRRTPAQALSGGERRRVEIARCLASEPAYVLLDEPFAGVDPIAVNDIRLLVGHLKERGIGVLITDHNVRETLEIIDRAYILHDGRVLMSGAPAEVIADRDVRRVYLGEGFRDLTRPPADAIGAAGADGGRDRGRGRTRAGGSEHGRAGTRRSGRRMIAPRLELRRTQKLSMTPQLRQAIELLQMSQAELSRYVEAELERNPLLSTPEPGAGPPGEARTDGAAAEVSGPAPQAGPDGAASPPGPGAPADWHGGPAGAGRGGGGLPGGEAAPDLAATVADRPSPLERLSAQIRLMSGPPQVRAAALALAAEVDEIGRLRADEAEVAARLGVDASVVAAGRAALQSCEPVGIGARDLAECLALQLAERDRLDPAMQALLANLPLLAKADMAGLSRRCGVDREDLQDMIAEIRALDPRPGLALGPPPPPPAPPDVLAAPDPDGGWRVELNPDALPRVLVDRGYAARVGVAGDPAARRFVAERAAAGAWLVCSLEQRARTVLAVASEIVRRQDGFLRHGVGALRPMTLKSVAEELGLHESTVSRAAAGKRLQHPGGAVELRAFFTQALAASDGGEAHSAAAVRARIRALIAAEAPAGALSDDGLTEALRAEGVAVARRTVAKYREGMSIPSSVRRRRLSAALRPA